MAMSETNWLGMFADNLKDILKDHKMSQRELADASGLSESVVSDYLRKKKMPGVRAIVNMAIALGIDVDELVNFDEIIY